MTTPKSTKKSKLERALDVLIEHGAEVQILPPHPGEHNGLLTVRLAPYEPQPMKGWDDTPEVGDRVMVTEGSDPNGLYNPYSAARVGLVQYLAVIDKSSTNARYGLGPLDGLVWARNVAPYPD